MTRYYYAMSTPYGCTIYSGCDELYRFTDAKTRNAWVRDAWNGIDYVDQCKRDAVTRKEARRWFPRAFAPDVQTFPHVDPCGDYWDTPDGDGACAWSGSPTGGEYAYI